MLHGISVDKHRSWSVSTDFIHIKYITPSHINKAEADSVSGTSGVSFII